MIERFEIKAALESLLFVASEPITIERAADAVGADKADVKEIMDELSDDYAKNNAGLKVIEIGGGFRMCTHQNCAKYVERYLNPPPAQGISHAALEVLAIIAYRQPITKAEVDAIRGVKSDRSVATLVQKKLIKETGRKDAPGRPIIYGTTKDFLICFGLNDLSELPAEEDFQIQGIEGMMMTIIGATLLLLLIVCICVTYRLRFTVEAKVYGETAVVRVAVRLIAKYKIVLWNKEIQIIEELQRVIDKAKVSDASALGNVKKKTGNKYFRFIESIRLKDVLKILPDCMRMDCISAVYSLDNPALLGVISGYANALYCIFSEIYDMNRYSKYGFFGKVDINPCFTKMNNSLEIASEISIRPYQTVYHAAKLAMHK